MAFDKNSTPFAMLARRLVAGFASLALTLAALSAASPAPAAELASKTSAGSLSEGFVNPPNSARPRVWWHWINGNVTKEGIAKDFAWMKSVGIGGLQNFDVVLGAGVVVERRLAYMTPEWKEAFRYAAKLADEAGLELAVASSPGWSETGGPWVQPKDAMKKLVWSESVVTGGKRFRGLLAQPPMVTGPFQTIALNAKEPRLTHYADIAVLAVPDDGAAVPPSPAVSSDGATMDATSLFDASLETAIRFNGGTAEAPGVVTLTYDSPRTIQSATLFVQGAVNLFTEPDLLPQLEVRDDATWRKIAELPLSRVPTTVSFAPVTAQEFRIVLSANTAPKATSFGAGAPGTSVTGTTARNYHPKAVRIAELRLTAEPKVDRFETKAGFTVARDYYALSANMPPEVQGVAPGSVLDLTALMTTDGSFDWMAPPGRWKVLRLGYSLLGVTNHPATPEATGLEVDKYDRDAVRNYVETYLGMYRDAAGPELMGQRGVQALLTDSIEVGASNWTPKLIAQFQRLRGYDPTPWLATLTGVVVSSRAQSDAFLYDFRRTLADLIATEHYGQVARTAREHGLKVYGEALEGGRPSLGDDMAMRAHADVPMAALWTYPSSGAAQPSLLGDMKGAASVAHVYGQNLVAAESLTSASWYWAHAPADLRRFIDLEFAYGVNRPVIHTSVHQPLDNPPGLSLAIFGQFFNRHETWAELAKPWIDYIARSSYLLQQGRHFADVAYFYGEEGPLTALFARAPLADTPTRYAYDFVNADALLDKLSVKDSELGSDSGARYRVLYLGGSSRFMTLSVLRRLADLTDAGATIVGDAPQASPGLKDDRAEFDATVRRLWGGGPVTTVGKGRVINSKDVEGSLASMGVLPDFDYTKNVADSEVLFLHRRTSDADIYFVNNRKQRAESIEARFRVTGKQPEIWRADTGAKEPVSYRTDGAHTVVPLQLLPEDSLFVVFRKPASKPSLTIAPRVETLVTKLDGAWDVSFEPGRGAPERAKLLALSPLSEHTDPGVKYFSGIATYTKTFTRPKHIKAGESLWLDLGGVGDIAEVRVNGELVGTAWKQPYQLDIGKATRAGSNELQVRVANLWVNRLIGDAQPNARRVAAVGFRPYRADAPLRPSGLMGPVKLLRVN